MADAPEPKEDRIGFAQLVEDALRGVVREALRKVGREGLPGEHHFYITCRTHYSGVELPAYLKERFPEEITLVLQHQFWDLDVADDHFAVNLTFSGKSERLRVPFAAVTGFVDPSIDFGLQFKPTTPALAAAAVAPTPTPLALALALPPPPPPPKADAKPAADKAKDGDGPKVVKLDTFRRG